MQKLFINAEIYDGESPQGQQGCVLVQGDRIEAILPGIPEGYAGEVIDLHGQCLTPGFIDTHSHNDFYAVHPDAAKYVRPFLRQGITTSIAGQCGFSLVGIDPDTPHADDLFAFFKKNPDFRPVTTMDGFCAAIDQHSPVNMACFCGHGSIRLSLQGRGADALREEQLQAMERRIRQALEEGASGLSFGLMYDPGMFAPPEELLRMARTAKACEKPVAYHARACSKASMSYPELLGRAHNLRALDEIIDIAQKTGVRSHVSHIIFVGRNTWPTLDETIEMIDGANESGLDISFDIYPFDFGASTINVALPSWYQGLTSAQRRKLFAQLRLRIEITATKKLLGFGFGDIQITYAGPNHPEYIGRRISELAREKGKGGLATYLDIVEETGLESTIIMYTYMNEHIVNTLSRHPQVHYMTDAWIVDAGMQNPAAFHSFPRFLRLSREGKAEQLGAMIRKMTGGAAERFGLTDRGCIKPGYFADLVAFDKDTICEGSGEQPPTGLSHVLVNGGFAIRDGQEVDMNLGRGLRAT